jgi:hypothetical protein
MSKRIYKPKPQTLETQIHVQRAYVAQCVNALEEQRGIARLAQSHGIGLMGGKISPFEVSRMVELIGVREHQLAQTQAKLDALLAEQLADSPEET